jgi:hypothetical protein
MLLWGRERGGMELIARRKELPHNGRPLYGVSEHSSGLHLPLYVPALISLFPITFLC